MAFDLEFESELAAPEDEVWAAVTKLEGVNRELGPWVFMTAPREARGKSLADVPLGEVAFVSTLLAFHLLPFDRHRLRLVEAERGHFLERSSSLLQKHWEHERWVEATPRGARVRDRLHVEPRLGLEPLTRAVVRALFHWRHRRLRERFGQACPSPGQRSESKPG